MYYTRHFNREIRKVTNLKIVRILLYAHGITIYELIIV